jgi:peptide/nickel transport system substrate-binding protein
MKKLRWQILIVIITLIIVGVLLLTQQPAETTNFIEPSSGGIYTEALVGAFGRLNPLFDLNNEADRDIDRLIFGSLIQFDSRGVPRADLAESWGVSADGMIYNFTIRPGATWHDGLPVTSDDVIFTLSLVRSQFSAYPDDVRAMWDMVEITRLDEKNLKFVLPEPFAPFLDYLTFGVLPKHLLETVPADQIISSEFNLTPIGSGPYKFEELSVEDGEIIGVVLTRNDSYYGQVPYIDQIVFRYYIDSAAALTAYQKGEVLGISRITSDILEEALVDENLAFYSSRLPQLTMVIFNLNNPAKSFFQEKNIRRALLMGLNRQWMVDDYLGGQGIVADSVVLPGSWAYYEGVEQISYDPRAAQKLLDETGYVPAGGGTLRSKDDVSLTFTLLYPETEFHKSLAETIQLEWSELGVDVILKPIEYETLLNDHLVTRNYEAALIDLDLSRSYDPDPYPFWHQTEATGGQNYSQWDNRAASEYLEQARVIADTDTRMRLYRNFQVIFAREIPALPLFFPVYTFGVDTRVMGVQSPPLFEPADRFNAIYNWFLLTQKALEETLQPTDIP